MSTPSVSLQNDDVELFIRHIQAGSIEVVAKMLSDSPSLANAASRVYAYRPTALVFAIKSPAAHVMVDLLLSNGASLSMNRNWNQDIVMYA